MAVLTKAAMSALCLSSCALRPKVAPQQPLRAHILALASDGGEGDEVPQLASTPRPAPEPVPPQLARSRALASEGLEGLPARASQLLQLGATFWLGLPALAAIIASLALVGSLYATLGDRFIHAGTPAATP
eukprot:CAMPEP_0205998660 /NCGR_PEP_ID=MMETSP1464-20131121/368_1 /ASSEMBLY_ACC=CAM_ASM_001124 /TAXON_ID=119497 /ORGANISM="Exanthemachrysis gayraliae, Strain RCC1523" /LENGTH=130 /DNA_ID=CAMNT_0053371811 /DNA_START=20 /DNA_END=412 /DNA_ORIENTATION=+